LPSPSSLWVTNNDPSALAPRPTRNVLHDAAGGGARHEKRSKAITHAEVSGGEGARVVVPVAIACMCGQEVYSTTARDGFCESISRKFTMGRKFSKHPSGSHISRHFVQKHKTNYFKTSLIQILGVDTGCAKII